MKKNKILWILFFFLPVFGLPILYFSPHLSLDVRLFYQHQVAMDWLATLSALDKNNYLMGQYFDLAYMGVYSAIFYLLLGKKGLIPGILDLIENFSVILYLKSGYAIPEHLGIVSGCKWISGSILGLMIMKRTAMYLLKNRKAASPN